MSGVSVQNWLENYSPNTQRAYSKEISAFSEFLNITSEEQLIKYVCDNQNTIDQNVSDFLELKHQSGNGQCSINRLLATIKSFVKYLNAAGMTNCSISLRTKNPNTAHSRSRIPDELYDKICTCSASSSNPCRAARDELLIFLAFNLLLKNADIANINIEDLDLENLYLRVDGSYLDISKYGELLFRRWLPFRRAEPGNNALLVSIGRGRRLTAGSVYHIIRDVGSSVGLKINPRTLRFAGMVEAMRHASSVGDVLNLARIKTLQV